MNDTPSRKIRPSSAIHAEVSVPPSKSYTNRALIVAALSEGTSILKNPSKSDDSRYLTKALAQFGIKLSQGPDFIEVEGSNGSITPPQEEIFIGNAGTAIRFLTTFAGLANGQTILTGDEAMQKRPIKDLLDALAVAGVKTTSNNGCPPLTVHGGKLKGGIIRLNATMSSQFVSSILLTAPYAKSQIHLHIKGKLSSTPYVDMTLHLMRSFGAEVEVLEPYVSYIVNNKDRYVGETFSIEGDASSATYFFAAAAITGGTVKINNLPHDSLQGDIKFLSLLDEMGCTIRRHETAIEVRGRTLKGIEVDMNDIPDCVPALAIVAAFADGETTITNVAHLRYKETDRLTAIATELSKLGTKVELRKDGLTIIPKKLHGAVIETYHDHRIAMSFAVAGLRIPGIEIINPSCVTKSFPNFWDEFSNIEGKH